MKKGITLIALVVTMMVLIILTSTIIYFGYRSLQISNNTKIYSNLKLVKEQISKIKERANDTAGYVGDMLDGYEKNLLIGKKAAPRGADDAYWSNWRKFTNKNLSSIDLSDDMFRE